MDSDTQRALGMQGDRLAGKMTISGGHGQPARWRRYWHDVMTGARVIAPLSASNKQKAHGFELIY
jgi:hypothetical protein